MLDGAPIHIAKVTNNSIKDIGLKMLNWPPNSLDLNPLENMWMICKDRVQKMKKPKNKEQTWNVVQAAWESIPMEMLNRLVASMPKRIQAAIDARGGSIQLQQQLLINPIFRLKIITKDCKFEQEASRCIKLTIYVKKNYI